MKSQIPLIVALLTTAAAFANGPEPKAVAPPEEDKWKFTLSVPGWMVSLNGTVGEHGIDSNADLGFQSILEHIDMVWSIRAEAYRGRFGIMGEYIYLGMSDSVSGGGPLLQKVDGSLAASLGDLAVRWRLLEGPRGFVDAEAGVRFTSIYQHLHLQSDDQGVAETSAHLVSDVNALTRDLLKGVLSEDEFRHGITAAVENRVTRDVEDALGPNPKQRLLAIGPIAARHPERVAQQIENIIREEEVRLQAEINAIKTNAANRAAEVQKRVDAAEGRMEKRIANTLDKELNRSFSTLDDWWDPYIGVHARYNFTPTIYVIGRADIGGFGIGSDLMWQAEGSLGFQLTRVVHLEAGYRALSFDYNKGGFKFDEIIHGPQLMFGYEF